MGLLQTTRYECQKKKKNHLVVIEIIHNSVIPEFLSAPHPFEPPKMSTVPRDRELWSRRIHNVLFLFLVFHPEICFSPCNPWPVQAKKGLSLKVLFHALVRDSVACTCFEIPATDTEKWELVFLASHEQYMTALRNRVQKSHYCPIWISDIKVKTSYFLTAYFPSGCPIITTTSVAGSGSSRVISRLWKPVMPFWFI